MASVAERLAILESERSQHRKELELFWEQKAKRDAEMAELKASVAKLCGWQKRLSERARYYGRAALFIVAAVGLQMASGAWGRLFGDLARHLLRGLL